MSTQECKPSSDSKCYISLKDMPLEDRRKEATKPLYLTRYDE